MQIVLRSRLEDCPICKRKRKKKNSLFEMCDVCHRTEMMAALPVDEREFAIEVIVRKRYIGALPEHIGRGLWAQLQSAVDSGVYLWGKTGVGKTYALAALARTFIIEGYLVERVSFEKLCLYIRDAFKQGSEKTTWSIIEPLIMCDKLFLEDVSVATSVGKQESDFTLRTLLVLLDERSEDDLPTFITGNKPPKELSKAFDERITSRLKQGKIIRLTGEDKR